jgi:hypothetical protein
MVSQIVAAGGSLAPIAPASLAALSVRTSVFVT